MPSLTEFTTIASGDLEREMFSRIQRVSGAQYGAVGRRVLRKAPHARLVQVHERFEKIKGNIEKEAVEEAGRRTGYESLTTNSRGARSADWLERTGKFFATGSASLCFTLAMVHPDVGIGASHRSPSTSEGTVQTILRLASSGNPKEIQDFLSGELNVLRQTIPADAVIAEVDRVLDEGIEEFTSLRKGGQLPSEGIEAFVHGLYFVPSPFLEQVGIAIAQRIISDPSLRTFGVQSISLVNNLGRIGEVRYGGKNHPLYSTPQFVEYPQ